MFGNLDQIYIVDVNVALTGCQQRDVTVFGTGDYEITVPRLQHWSASDSFV